MNVVQLTSSRFMGSVERQLLGLARALPEYIRTTFVSFSEDANCRPFLNEARAQGFPAIELRHDFPRVFAVNTELKNLLVSQKADLLCCRGYKATLLGQRAGRKAGIPVMAVSHGWTGENWKVRAYEKVERFSMRRLDCVASVSDAQADKVRQSGVAADQVVTIHDAVDASRFSNMDHSGRSLLESFFAKPPARVVVAAGRLSPEKGFGDLIQAAAIVNRVGPDVGFVLFGSGPLRDTLARQIETQGLTESFVLAGFRGDLDTLIPYADLMVLPSYTEGLPNVVLEAFAASLPVVATAVGGTPEVVTDGVNGFLVPPRNELALSNAIVQALKSPDGPGAMGRKGRERVVRDFSFEKQAGEYLRLFDKLAGRPSSVNLPGRRSANRSDSVSV